MTASPLSSSTTKINLLNDFTTNKAIAAHSIGVANGVGDTDLYKALEFALKKLGGEGSRRKAIVVLTDGVDTKMRDIDRKRLENVPDAEAATAIKPETSESLNSILNRADAQGVTIYPLALPTGDPARLADPTPKQIAMFKAARERLKLVADRTGGTLNTINRLEEMGDSTSASPPISARSTPSNTSRPTTTATANGER